MKKFLVCLLFLCSAIVYGQSSLEQWYQKYPFSNPYDATIIGSSMLMTEGVREEIPIEKYEILGKQKEFPELLWNQKSFRFSLVKQKTKAPLIFLLAGTGSDYDSLRMRLFQRILYDAGFHVISISSQMTVNFVASASSNHIPGILKEDAKDLYEVMKKAYQLVEKKIEVSEFSLLGYSLGATNAVFLSQLDEKEKAFQFQKVFMINPAVDLYSSATKLDGYLNQIIKGDAARVEGFLEALVHTIQEATKDEYSQGKREEIYKSFQDANLSDETKGALVGLAFRINAIDLNYVSDFLSQSGVYTKLDEKVGKFSPMLKYFVRVKFGDFESYVNEIALPHYQKKLGEHFSKESLVRESSLYGVKDYLKNSSKIVAVTNEDELILRKQDLEFLKTTMGDRLLIYPHGGHCGNMFYTPNVQIMLRYLKDGVFWNEK